MRVFKIMYAVLVKDEHGFLMSTSVYSERFICESIEEAIEYGKNKAKELNLHFQGVCEMKS